MKSARHFFIAVCAAYSGGEMEVKMNSHFITAVNIEKVRHLEKIKIPLSETTAKHLILTGKNGSGKTSVIEALVNYLNQYIEEPYNVASWKQSLEAEKNHLKNSLLNVVDRKVVENNIKYYRDQLNQFNQGVTAEIHNLEEFIEAVYQGNFIIAYYKATREYRVENQKVVEKVQFEDKYKLNDKPGAALVKYLLDLKTTEALAQVNGKPERAEEIKRWFQRFEKVLQQIFSDPQLYIDFNIETYEFKIVETGKEPFAFDALSSGYAAVLEIVSDLLMRMEKKAKKGYDLEGIVLIDEIETHLHLELQKDILPFLTRLFPNIQFVVTTHSPFILNSMKDVVIYDLANHILVDSEEGLSNLPYSGIVEGYFNASALSQRLKEKFERYKALAQKNDLTDDDREELLNLELYLDEIPDYLALDITTDYRKIKMELENR